MMNRIKLLFYFFKYLITKKNNHNSYGHLRKSYMVYHLWRYFNFMFRINSFFFKKYKINYSKGILGEINKNQCQTFVKEIDQNGFYVFEQTLDHIKINELISFASETPINYNILMEDESVVSSSDLKKYSEFKNTSNIFQFNDSKVMFNSELLKNIFFDMNFLHLANEYLKSKPIIDAFTMWWSNPVSQLPAKFQFNFKNSAAQMFHYDFDRMKILKFFIYLTDVDDNNGPHVFVKGSHKKPAFFLTQDGRYDDNLIYSKFGENVINLKGKKGTIIAVDTRGLHKGLELLEGERLILQIEFTNSLFGKPNLNEFEKIEDVFPLLMKKYRYTYSLYFE